MKNLLIYYFQILLPIPIIVCAALYEKPKVFVTALLLYILFRQYVDGYKLYKSGHISNSERLSPFLQIKHFKHLYFE